MAESQASSFSEQPGSTQTQSHPQRRCQPEDSQYKYMLSMKSWTKAQLENLSADDSQSQSDKENSSTANVNTDHSD
ncbi:hypothetical protein INT43_003872 [Umbelopsis isabellina]|uniref:Uncharacterized protein n=1 Tax=Mortierella isabellina TaxID=91625 RepID=A0A8H7PUE2_MORIS|nr:hypothetical protein INT43_003872 [Umbelopsis isabellina]